MQNRSAALEARRSAEFCAVRPVTRRADAKLVENPAAFREEDALEIHLQRLRVGGLVERLLLGDDSVLYQLEEGLVEVLHAIVGAGLDGGVEFFQAVFVN